MCEAIGITAQRFEVENGLHGKSENIEYLWRCATDIFILSAYVWEYNGLLNKNYFDDLDITDQGHIKDKL